MAIPISKFCNAESVSGWNMCLWGMPKLTIICGNCYGQFKTRDYIRITNMGNEYAAICPHCQKYNKTGLYPA